MTIDPLQKSLADMGILSRTQIEGYMRGRDPSQGEFNDVLSQIHHAINENQWLEKMNELLENLIIFQKTGSTPTQTTFLPVPGKSSATRIPHPCEITHPGRAAAKNAPDDHVRELAWVLEDPKKRGKRNILILTFDPHTLIQKVSFPDKGKDSAMYWTDAARRANIPFDIKGIRYQLCTIHQWFLGLDNKIEHTIAHPIDKWMSEAATRQGVDIYFATSLRVFGWYSPPHGEKPEEAIKNVTAELQEEFSRRITLFPRIFSGLTSSPHVHPGAAINDLSYKQTEEENLGKRYWDETILTADENSISDIHLLPGSGEGGENQCIVRLRYNGRLNFFRKIPDRITPYFLKKATEGSGIPINEVDTLRDGRRKWVHPITKKAIDLRISITPAMGQSPMIVMRLLDSSKLKQGVKELGLPTQIVNIWKKACTLDKGLVIISGPTNSGKSSTLYSVLQEIRNMDKERSIATIEDPIEFRLPFCATQIQIDPSKGLTYPNIIRQLMRSDPNTILVGEVRDRETCEAALQAALTGHQVLTTIHANSAGETITRILEFGVEKFIASESLKVIAAQRLVGTPCPYCMKVTPNHPKANIINPDRILSVEEMTKTYIPEVAAVVLTEHMSRWAEGNPNIPPSGNWVAIGENCPSCQRTGLGGRAALQEIAYVRPEDKIFIKNAEIDKFIESQRNRGLHSLETNAWEMAWKGIIPISEAIRMTNMLSDE
jgi:type II secretory ATPase GspE/PulE/Tfp pilus assembly ATPase PilB-like protein